MRPVDGLPIADYALLPVGGATATARLQPTAGQAGRARETFERAVAAVNDLGLLAEEVDAGSGEMIGNFPQAFSHIGLINAAWAIAQADQRAATGAKPAGPAGAGGAPGYGS